MILKQFASLLRLAVKVVLSAELLNLSRPSAIRTSGLVMQLLLGHLGFLGTTFLVSHYSAIGDAISCDAPYSAIGFRGKFFLRCPFVSPFFGL